MNLEPIQKMPHANFHLQLKTKPSMLAQLKRIMKVDFGVRLKLTTLENTYQEIMVIVQMIAFPVPLRVLLLLLLPLLLLKNLKNPHV